MINRDRQHSGHPTRKGDGPRSRGADHFVDLGRKIDPVMSFVATYRRIAIHDRAGHRCAETGYDEQFQ